jgi:hypothetical protein
MAPGVITTGRIMATVIRAVFRVTAIGPRWWLYGVGLFQGRRMPGDRLIGLRDRSGNPNRRGFGVGVTAIGFLVRFDFGVRYLLRDSNSGRQLPHLSLTPPKLIARASEAERSVARDTRVGYT